MSRHHYLEYHCLPGHRNLQQWEMEIAVEAVPMEYLETMTWTAQLTRDEKCLLKTYRKEKYKKIPVCYTRNSNGIASST